MRLFPLLLLGCAPQEPSLSADPSDLTEQESQTDPAHSSEASTSGASESDSAELQSFVPATTRTLIAGPGGVLLPVQIWYPAAEGSTGALHRYDGLETGEALDAAAADCSESRPVVAFSHGNRGIRWQSLTLTEALASRGFVVVAPDHVGNTIADATTAAVPTVAIRRPLDLIASYEALLDQETLAGCIAPEAGYLAAGHSFGGYTALLAAGATLSLDELDDGCLAGNGMACSVAVQLRSVGVSGTYDPGDPRVVGLAALAPWDATILGEGVGEIAVPSLWLTGEGDPITPLPTMVRPLFEALTAGPATLGVLPHGGHFSFVYDCASVGGPLADGCGPGQTPLPIVHALTLDGLLHLAGTAGQIPITPPLPEADEVAWEAR